MDEGRFASNMNRAITIVDDYLIYIIKRSRERERELLNSSGLFFTWMKKLGGVWFNYGRLRIGVF